MATVEIIELIKPETGEKFYPYAHLNGVKGAELLPRIGGSVQTTLPTPIFQIKDALNAQFYPQTHADAVIGLAQAIESNQFFAKESDGNGGFRIKLKDEFTGFYANNWVAAGGVGTGGGGGGGGLISTVYGESSLGTIYSTGGSESLTATFSAFAIDKIWQAVVALQQSTPNVSLVNGANYSTLTVNGMIAAFYTKAQVDGLISGIRNFEPVPVQTLPTASADTMYKLYLVPSSDPQSQNIKDEYITYRTGSAGNYAYSWEQVGSTAIDMSGYVTIGTAQTITGLKTFSGGIVMDGTDIIPSADLGSQLGYSNRRFSNLNVRTGSVNEINFKDSNNSATTGYLSFANGWMMLRVGANIDSSYKQIIFHDTYGLYPENGSSVNLGYYSSTDNRFRWANIYGVNEDLTGNLVLASSSHIDIGPARIEYDATTGAIHVTTNQTGNNAPTIGFFADGFSSAGGIGNGGGGGFGVEQITTSEDGTIDFHFTGGDVTTVDLNHVHPQYKAIVYLTDESQMPASPDANTLYVILESQS